MEFMDGAIDPVGTILMCLVLAFGVIWWAGRGSNKSETKKDK